MRTLSVPTSAQADLVPLRNLTRRQQPRHRPGLPILVAGVVQGSFETMVVTPGSGRGPGVRVALVATACVLTVGIVGVATLAAGRGSHSSSPDGSSSITATTRVTTAPTAPPRSTSTTLAPTTTTSYPPSDTTRLRLVHSIGGTISPKSVVASGHGIVLAQNMMYQHTITAYSSAGDLVATIPDSVDLAGFGVAGHPGISRGAPVEAAFSPGGRDVYVSNYSMYGAGFGPEGSDTCSPSSGYNDSFVYRLDVKRLAVDQVIKVGPVPKFVATTPDDRYVLVTNWCGYDLSVVDRAAGHEVRRIPLGPYPRGIAVSPDSMTAYIAVMGTSNVAAIDLRTFAVSWMYGVGSGPRHLALSPDGRWLYATLNGAGTIAKIDLTTRTVVGRVTTGVNPRSMTISPDGRALYVVNYGSDTVSKLRASDLSLLQTIATLHHPIGITYDRNSGSVWVACYVGRILVFSDT
jgi:YVTN family beta-propeller protein